MGVLYSRAFVASRGQVRVRMCVLKVVEVGVSVDVRSSIQMIVVYLFLLLYYKVIRVYSFKIRDISSIIIYKLKRSIGDFSWPFNVDLAMILFIFNLVIIRNIKISCR